jgi:hypothetical protein
MPLLRRAGCWALVGALGLAAAGGSSPALAKKKADDGDRPYWRTNLFKRVATDQKFLVTKWLPHELKDPLFVATLGLGVAIVVNQHGSEDAEWEQRISGSGGWGSTGTASGFTELGNGVTIAAVLGITYLSSRRAHDDRLSEATSLASESLLDAAIWVELIKLATARARPYESNPGSFFQYGASGSDSFPSGHSMAAFSVASVYAEKYRDKKWVPWLSYGLATLVGASRLALGRHFPGDVIVGAVLGTSIGRGVVARSNEEDAHRIKGTFTPVVGPSGRGVGVAWSYSWK